jgi:hypothetical protein
VPLATASVLGLGLAAPLSASAADSLGTGGVVIPGSALRVGVSGATGTAGAIEARFVNSDSPLYWGEPDPPSNMTDATGAMFALRTPTPALYSSSPYNSVHFTQTSPPAQSGTGTAGDPWVVASAFDAGATVHVTQTVTHIDGSTQFLASWSIHNTGGPLAGLKAFEGADLYVNQNDNGVGNSSGVSPNRVMESVAADGTAAALVEQPGSAWDHYFTGDNGPFYGSTTTIGFGHLPDTVDLTTQDSGEGAEWDFDLGAGATRTLSVVWRFTAPPPPLAPDVTAFPAALTTQTTATPHYAAHSGDALLVGFECSLDGATSVACTSPDSYTGLADGPHTLAVRGVNSAGTPGPATTVSWTVDTIAPSAPAITAAPDPITNQTSGVVAFSGEAGATFTCSVDGGTYAPCTSPQARTGLADGPHSLAVKQTDAAGHAGAQAVTASWTVDTTTPSAPASVMAAADSTATTASVTFTGDDALPYQCSLDAGAWSTCTSPAQLSGLSVGSHTLRVRQVSAAGTASEVASATWVVVAPAVTPAPVPVVCTSRRSIALHWRIPAHARTTAIVVTIDGKRYRRLRAAARSVIVDLSGKPAGSVTVRVTAIGRSRSYATIRVYRTCGVARSGAPIKTLTLTRPA